MNKTNHLASLIGRVFLIAQPIATKQWHGTRENQNCESDYDMLDNFISYEEGDLTLFTKLNEYNYYIYFCMSSKLEIFTVSNGFIICDGLYFNEALDYSIDLIFNVTEEIDFKINVTDELIYIFDAAIEGKSLGLNPKSGETKNSLSLNLFNGEYSAYKVETNVLIDDQKVKLKGIQISL